MLSVAEAAMKINLSEQRVRQLLKAGALAGERFGKIWLIPDESIAAWLRANPANPRNRIRTVPAGTIAPLRALSFFSGALGLDLGLEQAGIEILLTCEIDKHCRQTILRNRPDLALLGDIRQYSAPDIRRAANLSPAEEIDLVVGGPPCQAFSTAGSRRGFQDERGDVLLHYLNLICDLQPKYAVIENVRGLLSARLKNKPSDNPIPINNTPGTALEFALGILRKSGYAITFNLYNSANFGTPQIRERIVIICSRVGAVPFLAPTHAQNPQSWGLKPWATLRDAFHGLEDIQHDHVKFPEKRLKYYRLLKSGQYWKHLPPALQPEALGKAYNLGGGKTGFLRRLAWDKPACTLVTSPTMPATDMCHPDLNRPLSIQEYKRIQEFPDDYILCGKLSDQYKQIGNAVPIGLGRAIGRALIRHAQGRSTPALIDFPYSRYRNTSHLTWAYANSSLF